MTARGWKQLLDGWPWFEGEGSFPLFPFSEFMRPVHLGRKPYGTWDPLPFTAEDPWGWPITEYEEELTLRPGLRAIAGQLLKKLHALGQLVYNGGGDEVVEKVRQVRAGGTLKL